MTPLFKKLNFKQQPAILVLNHPSSFQQEVDAMREYTSIDTDSTLPTEVDFVLAFVLTLADIESAIQVVAPKLAEDAIIWFAYPKKSSKNYQCEFNRDTGWAVLGEYKLEGVRQVAIDADWSAIRFRHVDKIKKITRRASMALTKEAKLRTSHKG